MSKRLIECDEFGNADIIGVDSADLQLNLEFDALNAVTDALNRLADIEDILFDESGAEVISLARLREIAAAEREGRFVVLPCTNDRGSVSDGYHTFDELYEQRAILFSALCRIFPQWAWKSWLHSDGTMFDGCFIVGIDTPDGQYTYHYGLSKWDWFDVNELDRAPEWDGHTGKDVWRLWSLARAEAALAGKGAAE